VLCLLLFSCKAPKEKEEREMIEKEEVKKKENGSSRKARRLANGVKIHWKETLAYTQIL